VRCGDEVDLWIFEGGGVGGDGGGISSERETKSSLRLKLSAIVTQRKEWKEPCEDI
jgi:hypothetical protein